MNLALAIGAEHAGGQLSVAEIQLIEDARSAEAPSDADIQTTRAALLAGGDPLGDMFVSMRSADVRREQGAVYTPSALVRPMADWVLDQCPQRVVDPGSGSGRFLIDVLTRHSGLTGVAIDLDPVATLMTRAALAVLALENVTVLQADYTTVRLPKISGRTAFVGNPPYVRHHGLSAKAKSKAKLAAASLGHSISGLAGLHTHFFLFTALLARPGDVGCFVTSSEWLDVNYGEIVRTLLLEELGGQSIHMVEPTALPFEGTQTTAVITAFKVGDRPEVIRLQDVNELRELAPLSEAGYPIHRERLSEARRWSGLLHVPTSVPSGFIELGELCRVHRGTVTGANATWVQAHGGDLPDSVLFPSVTRARELFAAGDVLRHPELLKLVVDLPSDLDVLSGPDRQRVKRFLTAAKKAGVDKGYIAKHRRAWWSVGLKKPAPILATYMARRPPAFVMNAADAHHINIAHGLYPRQALDDRVLGRLAEALRRDTTLAGGRMYAGGLTKFEPREMERLLVPDLGILQSHEPLSSALDA
ncbi:Eco57I restriction-modification methylase domain-containing protein [Clavibacter sp. VKM Ac-2542]|uniref:Eco57I restriction-modification methylase domain-containing protein n=1 Tax=Clavibacter sp. VKM Ac-2542 TaxID=2783811 RepID=UPI00280B76AA|nr:N-6 DNA methylase [Clavibacter sp. VKM Ac-2542]